MSAEKKTGHLLCQAGSPTAKITDGSYDSPDTESSQKRSTQISERRAQMPRKYRAVYDRAVSGKSLRAAVNSFCLECCYWQSREVTLCTDLACPLWAVRPYRSSGSPDDGQFSGAESSNSEDRE